MLITLTSDFGEAYAAQVKGAILKLMPAARLIDISHHTRSIISAGWLIASSYHHFPDDSIHLAMCEPGSDQRTIMLKKDSHYFIGPDNGIFSFLLPGTCFSCPTSDSNFKARDLYPQLIRRLGQDLPPLSNPRTFNTAQPMIVHIDHFGNCITNLKEMPDKLQLNGQMISKRAKLLSDLDEPGLIMGSDGTVEICVNGQSAAALLGIEVGMPVG